MHITMFMLDQIKEISVTWACMKWKSVRQKQPLEKSSVRLREVKVNVCGVGWGGSD
jgi:hypothetical protein